MCGTKHFLLHIYQVRSVSALNHKGQQVHLEHCEIEDVVHCIYMCKYTNWSVNPDEDWCVNIHVSRLETICCVDQYYNTVVGCTEGTK